MPPKDPQQKRAETSAPPDSVTRKSETLPGDLRRSDRTAVAPDIVPDIDGDVPADEDKPLEDLRRSEDGGVAQHPIHDDDPEEDFAPGDYEEQIDKVADARKDRRARDIATKN